MKTITIATAVALLLASTAHADTFDPNKRMVPTFDPDARMQIAENGNHEADAMGHQTGSQTNGCYVCALGRDLGQMGGTTVSADPTGDKGVQMGSSQQAAPTGDRAPGTHGNAGGAFAGSGGADGAGGMGGLSGGR